MGPESSHRGLGRSPAAEVREPLGRRIADLRSKLGWTQQQLAERLGISRVAVSHLEAGTSVPGERTVALLAGLAKVEPHLLVEGTDYPPAKSDRLPLVAARYTEAELQCRLLEADLQWIAAAEPRRADESLRAWQARLHSLEVAAIDPHERVLLHDAGRIVRDALDALAE